MNDNRDNKIKSLLKNKPTAIDFSSLKSENICGVEFLTPIDSESIGIMVSGGADSAILLYYLMKNCLKNKIVIFTLGNTQRKLNNVVAATRVINRCVELTGNINIQHIVSYDKTQTDTNIFNAIMMAHEMGLTSYHYSGVTQNPPNDVVERFALGVTEEYRNVERKASLYDLEYRFFTPFARSDKSVIKNLYDEFGVLDTLFPLTRSCEYNETNEFFKLRKIENPGIGHCGQCWWCEERKWAFGRLE